MKIKEKTHPNSNIHSHPLNYTTPMIPSSSATNQVPTEKRMFHELASQLGLNRKGVGRLRENFAKMYRKHIEMINDHSFNTLRFLEKKHHQTLQNCSQIAETRNLMKQKQNSAKERRHSEINTKLNKSNKESEKCRMITEKNRKEYSNRLKNSVNLIKEWENKLEECNERKQIHLENVCEEAKQHNSYVEEVKEKVKFIDEMKAEQNIERMEMSIKLKCSYPIIKRFKTEQFNTMRKPKQSLSLKLSHTPRRSEIYNPEKMPLSNRSPKSTSESYSKVIKMKSRIDQERLEKLLLKNISKEERILEARSNHMNRKRKIGENLRQKMGEISGRHETNLLKIETEVSERNSKLDTKFGRNKSKEKLDTFRTRQNKSCTLSLPSIPLISKINQRHFPMDKQNFTTPINKLEKQDYVYLTDIKENKIRSGRTEANKYKSSRVYSEEEYYHNAGCNGSGDGGRYTRAITEKLRSLSLMSSAKRKRYEEFFEERMVKDGKRNEFLVGEEKDREMDRLYV